MGVIFRIDRELSYYTNKQESVEVSGNTLGECLNNLLSQFPELKTAIYNEEEKLDSSVCFYINGKDAVQDLSRPVKDGDKLDIVLLEL